MIWFMGPVSREIQEIELSRIAESGQKAYDPMGRAKCSKIRKKSGNFRPFVGQLFAFAL